MIVRAPFRLLAALYLSVFLISLQGLAQALPRQLYLLSGTPTEDYPEARFPVTLYKVSGARLELVREVVPQKDGLRLLVSCGDLLAAIHPTMEGTTLSVIHKDDPLRQDSVIFNPAAWFVGDAEVAIARAGPSSKVLLPIAKRTGPQALQGHVVAAAVGTGTVSTEVRDAEVSEYAGLCREGTAGGPVTQEDLVGKRLGNRLGLVIWGQAVAIDSWPPQLSAANTEAKTEYVPVVAAVSPEYVVMGIQRPAPSSTAVRPIASDTTTYVHDRRLDRWSTVTVSGNDSSLRLFGDWLAAIVRFDNSEHKTSPGTDSERSSSERGSQTTAWPDTRGMYADLQDKLFSPGKLTLQNLRDHRLITIATGQQDSEILLVAADEVIYRVNDRLYRAQIQGSALTSTSLVAQGSAVPEVHWVFWSRH